jgi:hypothetical protein
VAILELRKRLLNILIAVDQFLWVLTTLGNGEPDETISAAAWRMERDGKIAGRILRPLIDTLFRPFEKEHCWLSYQSELSGAQLPSSYRNDK